MQPAKKCPNPELYQTSGWWFEGGGLGALRVVSLVAAESAGCVAARLAARDLARPDDRGGRRRRVQPSGARLRGRAMGAAFVGGQGAAAARPARGGGLARACRPCPQAPGSRGDGVAARAGAGGCRRSGCPGAGKPPHRPARRDRFAADRNRRHRRQAGHVVSALRRARQSQAAENRRRPGPARRGRGAAGVLVGRIQQFRLGDRQACKRLEPQRLRHRAAGRQHRHAARPARSRTPPATAAPNRWSRPAKAPGSPPSTASWPGSSMAS